MLQQPNCNCFGTPKMLAAVFASCTCARCEPCLASASHETLSFSTTQGSSCSWLLPQQVGTLEIPWQAHGAVHAHGSTAFMACCRHRHSIDIPSGRWLTAGSRPSQLTTRQSRGVPADKLWLGECDPNAGMVRHHVVFVYLAGLLCFTRHGHHHQPLEKLGHLCCCRGCWAGSQQHDQEREQVSHGSQPRPGTARAGEGAIV